MGGYDHLPSLYRNCIPGKALDSEQASEWAVLTINGQCAATASLGTGQTKVDFCER